MTAPETEFYKGGWGGIRLWISKISWDEGRSLVVQQYTTGDKPDVQNRGGVPKVARVSLLFDDFEGEILSAGDRLLRIIELKDLGEAAIFTHPLVGTYLAEIGEFTPAIDESGTITADCTFTATEEVRSVVQPGSGATLAAGTGQVSAAADALDAELAAVGMPSAIPGFARAAAGGWGNSPTGALDGGVNPRQVLVDVAGISDRLWGELEDRKMDADIALWPAMKAYVMLGEAMRAAGAAATGDLGQLMTIKIASPISLRALLGGIYPADESDLRRSQALELNDIKTPGRLPTGTTLQLVQPKR